MGSNDKTPSMINELRKNHLRSLDSPEDISDLFSFEIKRCDSCSQPSKIGFSRSSDSSHSCCEYRLWQTLIDKQVAPATPLHPKCFSWINCPPESLTNETCLSKKQLQKRKENARFLYRPRLFQLLPSSKLYRRKSKEKLYNSHSQLSVDVIASTFNDPWGHPLGVSFSERMRQADEWLIKSTRIQICRNTVKCFLSRNSLLDLATQSHSTLGSQVLHIFQIASRGQFLSNTKRKESKIAFTSPLCNSLMLPPEISNLLRKQNCNPLQDLCSQWFSYDQYFSLSLFLASRYERSFMTKDFMRNKERNRVNNYPLGRAGLILAKSMRKIFDDAQKAISSNPRFLRGIRIFLLAEEQDSILINNNPQLCVPLIEMGSDTFLFKLSLLFHVDNIIASLNEEALIVEASFEDDKYKSKKVEKKHKSKNNKKKLKKDCAMILKESQDPQISKTRNDHSSRITLNHSPLVSKNIIPDKNRNRSLIIALAMVEVIINDAFQELGLNDQDESTDGNEYFKQIRLKGELFGEKQHQPKLGLSPHKRDVTCSGVESIDQQDVQLSFSNSVNIFDDNQKTIRHSNINRATSNGIDSFNIMDFTSVEMSLDSSGAFEDWSAVIGLEKHRSWLLEFFEDRKQVKGSSTAASIASSSESGDDKSMTDLLLVDDALDSDSPTLKTQLDSIVSESIQDDYIFDEGATDSITYETDPPFVSTLNLNSNVMPDLQDKERPKGGFVTPPLPSSPKPAHYVTLADIGELRKSCSLAKDRAGSAPSSPILFYKSQKMSLSQENLRLLLSKEIEIRSCKTDDTRKNLGNMNQSQSISIQGNHNYSSKGLIELLVDKSIVETDENNASCSNQSMPDKSGKESDVSNVSNIEEQCAMYRDICLTLGAEVSKLRNQLACLTFQESPLPFHAFHNEGFPPFDRLGEGVACTVTGPMSISGLSHRDQYSEDGENINNMTCESSTNGISRHSQCKHSVGVMSESDLLSDHEIGFLSSYEIQNDNGPFSCSMKSRLSADIYKFMNMTTEKLKTTEKARKMAITRIWKVITNLWPRAQVKLYGSHTCNLSLPSSDLDFVVCLPAVHQNAPAVAPGVLEGRNAINEPFQKVLARKLKGESWLDPRSIKTINRTAVPVIKVSTKDRRDKVLQLDISFASPEHHGLQAIHMVKTVIEEFPLVRPLVLVLKQFLQDRGLLTPYTGGLSSYCLFLLVTRYLQEQQHVHWFDCGSLLMGFLDFYGNSFDPRSTGVSVKNRCYFPRHIVQQQSESGNAAKIAHHPPSNLKFDSNLTRRHSFHDHDTIVVTESAGPYTRYSQQRQKHSPITVLGNPSLTDNNLKIQSASHKAAVKPYTFDPLFVEDPLSSSNNVGRNAFRIFQIKRAFADAHRALLAALEWDVNDVNNHEQYPLLKSLLQNEDIVLF